MKRTLKILGIIAASLAGLVVLASAAVYFFVDLDTLVNEEISRLQPELEEQLGRKIELGKVRTRFFPTLGARIGGVSVAGAEDAEGNRQEPLLSLQEAGFDLNLLRTILSFGSRIEVGTIFVDGLRLRVERDASGRLSFQDILDRQAGSKKKPKKDPSAQPSPAPGAGKPKARKDLDLLEAISIGEIRLRGASVELVDHQTPGGAPVHSAIRQIGLRLRDVRLSDPLRVELSAAVFAEKENFSLKVRVGPLPADLDFDRLVELRNLQLDLDSVRLGALAPYLGDALPLRLQDTVVSANFDIPHLDADSPLDVQGFLDVRALQIEGGEAFDLRLDARFKANPLTFSAQVDELKLRAAEMEVAVAGSLSDLDASPRFEDFSLRTASLDPARIFALYPALRDRLPPGSRLAGPAAIDLTASGDGEQQEIRGRIDLGAMDILVPTVLAKPASTPFALRVDGDLTPEKLLLRQAVLQVDALELELAGELESFEAPIFSFRLEAKPFDFDRLVRLAPSIGEELRKADATARGRGSLSGRIKGSVDHVDGELAVALLGASLDVPQATVRGDVRLNAAAKGNLKSTMRVSLLLDAQTAEVRVDELMNKSAGTPLLVDVSAEKTTEAFRFDRFDVRLAELEMTAKGSLTQSGEGQLAMQLAPLDLERFAATFPMIPAEKVKGGRVEAAVTLSGDPASLTTVLAKVDRFHLVLGGSDLSATASIENLERPVVDATLRSKLLDLDGLIGPKEAGAGGKKAAAEDNPAVKKITLTGTFEADRVILTERELRGFRGRVSLRDGVFTVEEGGFGIYGGSFRADGSEFEIWRGKMPFHLRFQGEGIDLESLVLAETGRKSPVAGKGKVSLDLEGVGIEREDLEKSLSGAWNLALPNGKVSGLGISHTVLGEFSSLPGFAAQRLSREEPLKDLLAGFAVENGRMALQKPLVVNLDGAPLRLDGAVGIFGELFLEGSYQVPAQRLAQLTGGRCKPGSDPVVPLKIGGKPLSPEVRPDATGLAVELVKACLGGQAEKAVDELLGDGAAAKAKEAADDLKKAAAEQADEAKAAAQREIDEAKAAANAEVERLKAEAEKKRKEAEAAAKKKAQDAAKKLKDKLF